MSDASLYVPKQLDPKVDAAAKRIFALISEADLNSQQGALASLAVAAVLAKASGCADHQFRLAAGRAWKVGEAILRPVDAGSDQG